MSWMPSIAEAKEFVRLHILRSGAYRRNPKAVLRQLVTACAFLLGYIGYHKLHPPDHLYQYLENFYRTMGLLVISMPKEYPHLPVELQVARFALPITVIWMSVHAFLDNVRRPLRLYATIGLEGHLAVVGGCDRAIAIALEAQRAGRQVVSMVDDGEVAAISQLERRGVLVVVGATDDVNTCLRAAIPRAADAVVCTGNNLANLRAAIEIRNAVRDSDRASDRPLMLVVESSQDDVTAILDGAFTTIRDDRIEYRRLWPDANLARGLLPRIMPQLGKPAEPGAMLFIGCTRLSAVVFDHVLRNAPPGAAIAVAADDCSECRDRLLLHRPGLAGWGDLSFHCLDDRSTVPPSLEAWLTRHPAAAVMVEVGGDEANLLAALSLRRFARDRSLPTGPLFVHQSRSGLGADALDLIEGELIDLSRIVFFGSLADESKPEVVLQAALDDLARIIHEDYLAGGASGDAAVPWRELPETYRQASRFQADHVSAKLAAIDCGSSAVNGPKTPFAFREDEIEMLAALEHHRWCVDRWLDGWRFAAVKNVAVKTHPSLVAYEELSEDVKEFDRRTVRNIPALLRAVGREMQRFKRIPVGDGVLEADVADAVADASQNGALPLLDIELASEKGILVAEWALGRGVQYEIIMRGAVTDFRRSLPWGRLKPALEGASRVCFHGHESRPRGAS